MNRSKSTVAIPYDGIMFTPIHGSHQGRPAQSTHPAWWTVTGYQGSANQASPIHPSCMVDCHWIPIKALLTRPAQSTHPAWWTATGYQGTANQASPIHPSCMVNWNSLKIKAEHIAAHRAFDTIFLPVLGVWGLHALSSPSVGHQNPYIGTLVLDDSQHCYPKSVQMEGHVCN